MTSVNARNVMIIQKKYRNGIDYVQNVLMTEILEDLVIDGPYLKIIKAL